MYTTRCTPASRAAMSSASVPSTLTDMISRREPRIGNAEQAARELVRERMPALDERPGDHVVQTAPRERDRDEGQLHEQDVPVTLRPEVGHLRQAEDAQVDAGGDQQRDQDRRQPRVA